MKQNKQYSLFFWIASFLAMTLCTMVSCTKEIDFNGEQVDPKLVINSLNEPGQPVKAYISKSVFFLDTESNTQAPDDLVATLYVNGNRIGEMTHGFDTIWEEWFDYDDDGNPIQYYHLTAAYHSTYIPVEGDVVKITASANGFDDVDGTTSPLPKFVDCQMETEITSWESYYFYPYFTEPGVYEEDSLLMITGSLILTFDIKDPNPGVLDYFRLRSDTWNYDGENRYFISYAYDDPVFGASLENDYIDASDLDTRPEGVFTDALFDGKSYQLKLNVYFEMNVDEVFDPAFFCVPFKLEHLSKEYYNYLCTCNQDDGIMQFFAEPVQTYTNVNGGYGIVGGCAVDSLKLELPLEE